MINPFTASHPELVEAALKSFEDRAVLSRAQKARWAAQSRETLAAVVYLDQRLQGVSPSQRQAVYRDAEAEGVIRLTGKGAMAHYELVIPPVCAVCGRPAPAVAHTLGTGRGSHAFVGPAGTEGEQ
jgi:hypothetical protein